MVENYYLPILPISLKERICRSDMCGFVDYRAFERHFPY